MQLPAPAWQSVTWRDGSNAALSSRFAAARVRPAHRDYWQSAVRDEEWLFIEWPDGNSEPLKYFLTTVPEEVTLEKLVFVTKMRWRIERDSQELKQEFGLCHHEGRGWRGFHHHATLSIAAYGFLMAQRLRMGSDPGNKKTSPDGRCLSFPRITSLAAFQRAQRHVPDSITTLRVLLAIRLLRSFLNTRV
jgi:SRSO17 transposase